MKTEEICDLEKCTGCLACLNICPRDAISVRLDVLGSAKPYIDSTKCVSCKLCQIVCQNNNESDYHRADFCYAAWSKNAEDVRNSSSGGVASVLSRAVLQNGGVVYGASCENERVYHKRIDNVMDIGSLRGSKYVQSDIGMIYRAVKNDLQKDTDVLFIGTPCQVSGLKLYLGRNPDNLTTIDLVCHGVPPFVYLKEYLDGISDWDRVTFRGKDDFRLTSYKAKKVKYQNYASYDLYFNAFLKGLIFRDNCYDCKFARPERVGDITLGDFWGIDRNKLPVEYGGKISLVLPNTKKGNGVIEKYLNEIELTQFSLDNAINPQQANLLHASIPHKDREIFRRNYESKGFVQAVKMTEISNDLFYSRRKSKKQLLISIINRIRAL